MKRALLAAYTTLSFNCLQLRKLLRARGKAFVNQFFATVGNGLYVVTHSNQDFSCDRSTNAGLSVAIDDFVFG